MPLIKQGKIGFYFFLLYCILLNWIIFSLNMKSAAINLTQIRVFSNYFSDWVYRCFLILLGFILLFLIVLVKSKTAVEFWADPLVLIYTVFVTTFELSRVVGAIFYKHTLKSTIHINHNAISKYEPTVTFIIPCKNEEKSIAKTINKCFYAEYHKDKIEVIVINDGSTDGTIEVLNSLKKTYPNLIIINWRINRGKRHGMAAGFSRAKGEIIVQLDSDSYIEPKSVKKLIEPFSNPEIGAVCAHADPANADDNFLTKMQAAYYFVSFGF